MQILLSQFTVTAFRLVSILCSSPNSWIEWIIVFWFQSSSVCPKLRACMIRLTDSVFGHVNRIQIIFLEENRTNHVRGVPILARSCSFRVIKFPRNKNFTLGVIGDLSGARGGPRSQKAGNIGPEGPVKHENVETPTKWGGARAPEPTLNHCLSLMWSEAGNRWKY